VNGTRRAEDQNSFVKKEGREEFFRSKDERPGNCLFVDFVFQLKGAKDMKPLVRRDAETRLRHSSHIGKHDGLHFLKINSAVLERHQHFVHVLKSSSQDIL
jgi:hypothetical protein